MTKPTYIEPAKTEFVAPDWQRAVGALDLGRHDDGTMTARIVGRRGRVIAWIEISADDVAALRDYLNGGGK